MWEERRDATVVFYILDKETRKNKLISEAKFHKAKPERKSGDRTSPPLVMPALVIGKGRENHCVQLPREEVHPRAMAGGR